MCPYLSTNREILFFNQIMGENSLLIGIILCDTINKYVANCSRFLVKGLSDSESIFNLL